MDAGLLFDPSILGPAFSYTLRTVTIATTSTLICDAKPSRVGVIFSVPTSGGTTMYITPTSNPAVNTGIRLDAAFSYREYMYPFHIGLAQAQWNGIVSVGTQAMSVIECFYAPERVR